MDYFENVVNIDVSNVGTSYNAINAITGSYGSASSSQSVVGVSTSQVYTFRTSNTEDWRTIAGSSNIPAFAILIISNTPYTAVSFRKISGSYSQVTFNITEPLEYKGFRFYHDIGGASNTSFLSGYYAQLVPQDFETICTTLGINRTVVSYPITYRLTNCTAPTAPEEAAVGDTVTVPLTFPSGYGIVNESNVYVQNNGVTIPSTYANGTLTFTMPDPS